jgi:hypothetical protein
MQYKSIKAKEPTYWSIHSLCGDVREAALSQFLEVAVEHLARELRKVPQADRPDWYRRLRGELLGG